MLSLKDELPERISHKGPLIYSWWMILNNKTAYTNLYYINLGTFLKLKNLKTSDKVAKYKYLTIALNCTSVNQVFFLNCSVGPFSHLQERAVTCSLLIIAMRHMTGPITSVLEDTELFFSMSVQLANIYLICRVSHMNIKLIIKLNTLPTPKPLIMSHGYLELLRPAQTALLHIFLPFCFLSPCVLIDSSRLSSSRAK